MAYPAGEERRDHYARITRNSVRPEGSQWSWIFVAGKASLDGHAGTRQWAADQAIRAWPRVLIDSGNLLAADVKEVLLLEMVDSASRTVIRHRS